MFHRDFPGLRDRHDVESVVDESWARLMRALETVRPPTVEDFLRLVAHKVRQVLLDMAGHQKKRDDRLRGDANGHRDPIGQGEPADDSLEPGRLAPPTEFHRQVENLPIDQRTVFDLHYYTDLPQAEIARLLGLHPRKVSYLWVAATEAWPSGSKAWKSCWCRCPDHEVARTCLRLSPIDNCRRIVILTSLGGIDEGA